MQVGRGAMFKTIQIHTSSQNTTSIQNGFALCPSIVHYKLELVQLSVGREGCFQNLSKHLCHWQFDLLMQPGLPETIWARAFCNIESHSPRGSCTWTVHYKLEHVQLSVGRGRRFQPLPLAIRFADAARPA